MTAKANFGKEDQALLRSTLLPVDGASVVPNPLLVPAVDAVFFAFDAAVPV